MAGGQIDDAQSAMTERGVRIQVHAGIIGSAMGDDVAHAQHAVAIVRSKPLARNDSCDSAHTRASSFAPAVRNIQRGRGVSGRLFLPQRTQTDAASRGGGAHRTRPAERPNVC